MDEPDGDVIVQDKDGQIWTRVEPGAWEAHASSGARRYDSWADLEQNHGPIKVYRLHD